MIKKSTKEEENGKQVLGCLWLLIMGGLISMWTPLSLGLAGLLLLLATSLGETVKVEITEED
jgi:hypothetical protein